MDVPLARTLRAYLFHRLNLLQLVPLTACHKSLLHSLVTPSQILATIASFFIILSFALMDNDIRTIIDVWRQNGFSFGP